MWTNLERTVSHEGKHYNQSDQVVLSLIMYEINYINEKHFYIRYATWVSGYHWLHVSKGQTILLQWCDLTSSGDGST